MKKLTLSFMAILAINSFVVAGGHIKNVEQAVEEVIEIPTVDESAFYVGAGYGLLNQTSDNVTAMGGIDAEWEVDMLLLQVGYQYNKYIAVEGRYWYGLSDVTQNMTGQTEVDVSGDYSAWGVYLKPMYPLGDLNVYGLLGYASVILDGDNGFNWETDGLSWGVGLQYAFTDNLSVFADYIMMGEADEYTLNGVDGAVSDISIDTINVGLTYTF